MRFQLFAARFVRPSQLAWLQAHLKYFLRNLGSWTGAKIPATGESSDSARAALAARPSADRAVFACVVSSNALLRCCSPPSDSPMRRNRARQV